MTRSEERLNVGTRTEEAGRARLRKHVVTEQQTVNVPVTREEVTIEREPITEANADQAFDGPAISEEEHEVVLHEERPVVEKEAVPVERVRLGTESVKDVVGTLGAPLASSLGHQAAAPAGTPAASPAASRAATDRCINDDINS